MKAEEALKIAESYTPDQEHAKMTWKFLEVIKDVASKGKRAIPFEFNTIASHDSRPAFMMRSFYGDMIPMMFERDQEYDELRKSYRTHYEALKATFVDLGYTIVSDYSDYICWPTTEEKALYIAYTEANVLLQSLSKAAKEAYDKIASLNSEIWRCERKITELKSEKKKLKKKLFTPSELSSVEEELVQSESKLETAKQLLLPEAELNQAAELSRTAQSEIVKGLRQQLQKSLEIKL